MDHPLSPVLDRLAGRPVLVVGDAIRDVDAHGRCDRYAPEAAGCTVFAEEWREERPGGAGAVAAMARAPGATVELVTGPDASVKTRYHADGRQLWRHDADAAPISPAAAAELAGRAADAVDRVAAVLVADYGKGGCPPAVIRAVLDRAGHRAVPCVVDPVRNVDWQRYRGAGVVKCNAAEWARASAGGPSGWWEPHAANVVVTTGPTGMTHYPRQQPAVHYPTAARPPVDVTGCGDMVLAVLGVCAAAGVDWPAAIGLANVAAGLKVGRRGAVPITRSELAAAVGGKILGRDMLAERLAEDRAAGRRVVMTGGCFDPLHPGHVHLLTAARQLGDVLAVAVHTDAAARLLNGPGRPVTGLADRLAVLAALGCVDYLCAVDEDTPALIDACRPHVWVNDGVQSHPMPEAEAVRRHGGEIQIIPTRLERPTIFSFTE